MTPKLRKPIARRRPGRPTLLTPAVLDRVCKALREGATWEWAAMVAGIGPATLFTWKAKGTLPDAPPEYGEFLEAVTRAREEWVQVQLREIERAASTPNAKTGQLDWRAREFLLETMERDRFGKARRVELEHAGFVA